MIPMSFCRYLLCLAATIMVLPVIAQTQIRLKAQKPKLNLEHYHISNLQDDRKDTTNIGRITAGSPKKLTAINLAGGAATSLDQYIRSSVTQAASSPALSVHIERLDLSEKEVGGRQEVTVTSTFALYRDSLRLCAHSGNSYVQHSMDVLPYLGELVRRNLERSLQDFDNWLKKNPLSGSKPGVQVKVVLDTISKDPDEIAFRKSYALKFDDFRAEPDELSRGSAATYSGIQVNYSSTILNGHVDLVFHVSALFGKKRSWCRPSSKNAETLQHEQLHFTLTAVQLCKLIRVIEQYPFSPVTYPEQAAALQKQQQQELDELQQRYDKETAHSRNRAEQARWEQQVRQWLDTGGCY